MSFLTALLDAYGGYGQGRQQKFQNQQTAQDAQLRAQQQQQEAAYQQGTLKNSSAELAQERADAAERAKNDAATRRINAINAGLDPDTLQPRPFTIAPPPTDPNQTTAWIASQINAANKAGRSDQISNIINAVNAGGLYGQRDATTQVDLRGKLPLMQAETDWWKQKHSEVMAAINQRANAAQIQAAARGYAAREAHDARLATAGADAKAWIAATAALNANGRQNDANAERAAIDAYQANLKDYYANKKTYEQTQGALGTPPGPVPTYQPPNVTVSPVIYMPAPGGGVQPMTVDPVTRQPVPYNAATAGAGGGGNRGGAGAGTQQEDPFTKFRKESPAQQRAYLNQAVANGWLTPDKARGYAMAVGIQGYVPPAPMQKAPVIKRSPLAAGTVSF